MFDDFVVPATTTIGSIAWQGAYCSLRAQRQLNPPQPVARSFRVQIHEDQNGIPRNVLARALHEFTFSPTEAKQELEFTTDGMNDDSFACPIGPMAYYRYAVTLPSPLTLGTGVTYWLRITADVIDPLVLWGWRVGTQGNSRSIWYSGEIGTFRMDQAFSLTSS
jgi:hypothetical protein